MAPVYAQRADFEAYVEGWTTTDPAALDRLLGRAELDVDWFVGPWFVEANGRKFGAPQGANEKGLTTAQKDALKRATCAQAEYRWTQGEDFMVRAQHEFTSGPDFATRGELPYIGPKARRELAGSGLRRRGPITAIPMSSPHAGYPPSPVVLNVND